MRRPWLPLSPDPPRRRFARITGQPSVCIAAEESDPVPATISKPVMRVVPVIVASAVTVEHVAGLTAAQPERVSTEPKLAGFLVEKSAE